MLTILLADDGKDDCFFFKKALEELPVSAHPDIVHGEEQLMKYLSENFHQFRDIPKLKDSPLVVIYPPG